MNVYFYTGKGLTNSPSNFRLIERDEQAQKKFVTLAFFDSHMLQIIRKLKSVSTKILKGDGDPPERIGLSYIICETVYFLEFGCKFGT